MLTLPDHGFLRSVNFHNVNTSIMCDWIEASAVFLDEPATKREIIDILCEGNIYSDQDFAAEQVELCWIEINRRVRSMGMGSPIVVEKLRISKDKDSVAHSLCMMLSRAAYYDGWSSQFGSDYNVQGDLFEDLTYESLCKNGWLAYKTGWSSEIKRKRGDKTVFRGLIARVADLLKEQVYGNLENWISSDTNEAGLDIVSCKPFTDEWPGIPVYFIQCASGAKWQEKKSEPDVNHWAKMIDFSLNPQRAIAIPFSLSLQELKRETNSYQGVIIDRYRILSAGDNDSKWLSESLSEQISVWLAPRVLKLETM